MKAVALKKTKFPTVLTTWFVTVALAPYILYPGVAGYQMIQDAKFGMFIVVFGGYVFLMLLCSVELIVLKWLEPRILKDAFQDLNLVQRLVLVYWATSLASGIFSEYYPYTWLGMSRNEGMLTISMYCGIFLLVSFFGHIKRWMFCLFGGTMSIFCVICLLQTLGYNPFGLYPDGYNYFDAGIAYAGAYLGTVGNAGLAAAILCLAFPIFLVLVMRTKSGWKTWLAPGVLCAATLVRINVKAGLVALFVGILVMFPVVFSERKGTSRGLLAGTGFVFFATLLWIALGNHAGGTLHEIQEVLRGNWNPGFGSGRIYIWKEVLSRIPQHLWFGTGPDTMAAAQIIIGDDQAFVVDVAHNEYLNILYHQGVLSLVPYLAALLISLVQWVKYSPRNMWVAALGSGVLCYSIQAFFSFSACQSTGIFWIIWALFECAVRQEEITS